jgi:hypothetical protein
MEHVKINVTFLLLLWSPLGGGCTYKFKFLDVILMYGNNLIHVSSSYHSPLIPFAPQTHLLSQAHKFICMMPKMSASC